jgi:AcrR family transcriptional regulator
MGRSETTIERILDVAVECMNAEGVAHVSLRGIAEAAGISHGNLRYHFSGKEALLLAIYARMKREMDGVVYPGGGQECGLGLDHYHVLLSRISAFHLRYRFFYLDLREIARSFPRVIACYRDTIAQRFAEHDRLIADLIARSLLEPESSPGFYRATFHTIWVMSTFWLQHEEILGAGHPVIDGGNDVRHAWDILLPHLTGDGRAAFRAIAAREGWDAGVSPIHAHFLGLGS